MKKHSVDIRSRACLKRSCLLMTLVALSFSSGAQAAGLTDTTDIHYTGKVSINDAAYSGDSVEITGKGFKPDQKIQLSSDGTTITTQPFIHADNKGNFKTRVNIPAKAPEGIHPVVVQSFEPSYTSVFDFKISPRIPLSNTENFQITRAAVNPGVYQGGYSVKSHAIFITASVGHPPIKESTLTKVNPETLAIEHQVTPPMAPDGKQLEAVYGIAIDDVAGTVWTGSTRTGAVTVYKQDDLSVVKQFPDKVSPHSFGLAVNGPRHRAYVAAHGKDFISVFNTETLEPKSRITLDSPTKTKTLPAPLSLTLDQEGGKLYAVTTTDQVYVIDEASESVEKVFNLKGATGATGIAYAPEEKLLFVAAQVSDRLQILDARDGTLKAEVKVGAGPLSVVWEPAKKLAYVACRASNSVAVVNAQGKLVANLPGGSYANHLFTDGKGTVFGLNKSHGAHDKEGDHISRYIAK
ncbi:MAG: YncE family protein [Lautropia sp.]|nr:YncE family protein [Lautropia sp.]